VIKRPTGIFPAISFPIAAAGSRRQQLFGALADGDGEAAGGEVKRLQQPAASWPRRRRRFWNRRFARPWSGVAQALGEGVGVLSGFFCFPSSLAQVRAVACGGRRHD